MRQDYSVQCWGTTADGLPWDQSYLTMFFYALVMTLVYPIGTPLLFSAERSGSNPVVITPSVVCLLFLIRLESV